MKNSEEKRTSIDFQGFVIRINKDEVTKTALEKVIFTLEIICNVPILILQFPKPYQIIMIPVELSKNTVFAHDKQLRIRMELAGIATGEYIKEILLSETDTAKINQCRMNLPKRLTFGQAQAREDYTYREFAD